MMQLLRYSAVGILNTGLGYTVIFLCMGWLGWGGVVSNMAGYSVGFVTSFILNKRFTFQSKGEARRELARFLMIFVLAYLANLGALVVLTRAFEMHVGWAQVVAGGVYFVSSFMLNKYYVFAHRDPRIARSSREV